MSQKEEVEVVEGEEEDTTNKVKVADTADSKNKVNRVDGDGKIQREEDDDEDDAKEIGSSSTDDLGEEMGSEEDYDAEEEAMGLEEEEMGLEEEEMDLEEEEEDWEDEEGPDQEMGSEEEDGNHEFSEEEEIRKQNVRTEDKCGNCIVLGRADVIKYSSDLKDVKAVEDVKRETEAAAENVKRQTEGAQETEFPKLEKSKLDWFFGELFPIRNFHYLLKSDDVRNLRRVCKAWRDTVDSFLETANDLVEPNYKDYKSIMTSPFVLAFQMTNKHARHNLYLHPRLDFTEQVVRFLEGTRRHPRNPFLSRRAEFSMIFDNDLAYWTNALAVLKKYGEELRTLNIFYRSSFTMVEMLNTLMKCLDRCPLLTTLDFHFITINKGDDGTKKFPMPEFPPLESLTRLLISFQRSSIFQPFTVYFDQLISLHVSYSDSFMDWLDPAVHSTFPKLQHLAICVTNEVGLFKLLELTSQLRELLVEIKMEENVCPSVVLHVVERFKKTLCVFKLEQELRCNQRSLTLGDLGLQEPAQFDLPHLKTFSLTILDCGFGPVDHLLKLSKGPDFLEIIACSSCTGGNCFGGAHVGDYSEGEAERLQIHECLDDMYKSNVWRMLPNLKEIHVRKGASLLDPTLKGRSCFTRALYELKKKDGNPRAGKRPKGRFD